MASGLDLSDYFADWIQQPGWAFESMSEHHSENGWIVQLTIGQKQWGPSTFYHNVPITVAVLGVDPDPGLPRYGDGGRFNCALSLTVPFQPAFVWLNDDDRPSLAFTGSTHTITTTAPSHRSGQFGVTTTRRASNTHTDGAVLGSRRSRNSQNHSPT